MARELPPGLKREIAREVLASLERGKAVRRRVVLWSVFGLVALLVALAALEISGHFVIAVTVATASIYIIWAIMSLSASLNAQSDALMEVILYYAESKSSLSHPDTTGD